MAQVLRTSLAETDLLEIWVYTAEFSTEAADRLLSAIGKKCQLLAESPLMGRAREELSPSLRSTPEGNYLIFYRPVENGVEIVRILHSARDMESNF